MRQYQKVTVIDHSNTPPSFYQVVDMINEANTVDTIQEVEAYINRLPDSMKCGKELANMALEKKWFLLMKMETVEERKERKGSLVWVAVIVIAFIIWRKVFDVL